MNRRTFLRKSGLFAGGMVIYPFPAVYAGDDAQSEKFSRLFSEIDRMSLLDRKIGDIVVEVGKYLIGFPYKAGTLETAGRERLTVNLDGFDCVTYIETVLSLARCIRKGSSSFESFKRELQVIRYRGGEIAGYPSRLHYFSDWIFDNGKKGIVEIVVNNVNGMIYNKRLNFLSANRNLYAKLAVKENYSLIRSYENVISDRNYYYMPKNNFSRIQPVLKSGDIIGFTTSIRGLDIMHTAIAIKLTDDWHIMHASDLSRNVEISGYSIAEYMNRNRSITGIMIARPV